MENILFQYYVTTLVFVICIKYVSKAHLYSRNIYSLCLKRRLLNPFELNCCSLLYGEYIPLVLIIISVPVAFMISSTKRIRILFLLYWVKIVIQNASSRLHNGSRFVPFPATLIRVICVNSVTETPTNTNIHPILRRNPFNIEIDKNQISIRTHARGTTCHVVYILYST